MAMTLAAPPSPSDASASDRDSNPPRTPVTPDAQARADLPRADPAAAAALKRKPSRRANTAERRATHNAVERQRRETLNGRFLDLAALLPNLAQIRRPSKSSIVNSSIAHIHASRRHRLLAARELRLAKLEADALRRELNEWRDRAGLPRVEEPVRSDAFSMVLSGELEIVAAVPGDDDDDEDGPVPGYAAYDDADDYAMQPRADDDAARAYRDDPRAYAAHDAPRAAYPAPARAPAPLIASPTAPVFEDPIHGLYEPPFAFAPPPADDKAAAAAAWAAHAQLYLQPAHPTAAPAPQAARYAPAPAPAPAPEYGGAFFGAFGGGARAYSDDDASSASAGSGRARSGSGSGYAGSPGGAGGFEREYAARRAWREGAHAQAQAAGGGGGFAMMMM